jgi:sec-independent protein translocase protein TatB
VGFSLSHIFLMVLVAIIVVGPKRLPEVMRTAGQWVAKLRRMSSDLRSQSGIDDILRNEGLDQHISELRSLSRFNVVDTLMAPSPAMGPRPVPVLDQPAAARFSGKTPVEPSREREYPLVGCDAYGAVADDAAAYLPAEGPVEATEAPEGPAKEEPAQEQVAAVHVAPADMPALHDVMEAAHAPAPGETR